MATWVRLLVGGVVFAWVAFVIGCVVLDMVIQLRTSREYLESLKKSRDDENDRVA